MHFSRFRTPLLALAVLALAAAPAAAQSAGSLAGTVTLKETGGPLHVAHVLIVELGRSTLSDYEGKYEFDRVPPGRYHVIAHLDHVFTESAQTVEVTPGQEASLDFMLALSAENYEITVTASEQHETTLESFQDVESLNPYELTASTAISLGEALDHRVGTGIAKRSFGTGSSRPIIRGFDSDRVIIMEDGINTGTLSSTSGDHGELINVGQLARLEIVKGPSTLLYSGNAMGGTVNAVGRHHEHHLHPHEGFRGFLSGSGGTTNALAGANAGFELGAGNFMLWGSGGGIRTSDYTAPQEGQVFNSRSNMANGGGGLGWYGDKMYLSGEVKVSSGIYGIPFAHEFHGHHDDDEHHDEDEEEHHDEEEEEEDDHGHEEEIERIELDSRLTTYRLNWGLRNLAGPVQRFSLKAAYTDWKHDEIEHFEDGDSHIGTTFQNDRITYRGVFEQAQRGPWSGRFGIWGVERDYEVTGEEALSPPIDQRGLAFFALEELDFERVKFQFGGRVETQRYDTAYAEREAGHVHEDDEHEEDHDEDHDEDGHEGEEHSAPDAVDRAFTGASAAFGIHVDTWNGGAFVANFSRSYRAPSIEELYNFGPHPGNRAFEIGDPSLEAESGNGIDFSVRHQTSRVRGEVNFFYYRFNNFIFPFANGEEVDGLPEIEFTQRDARFLGAEASVRFGLHDALDLSLGMDYVDAQDTSANAYLPRIPPLRGRVGLDLHMGGFRLAPELVMASEQDRTFTGETRTPGYTVINLKAAYIIAGLHNTQQFAVEVFNVGDRLYRNHSSFIKDLAPEIGRGVRFSYTFRFF